MAIHGKNYREARQQFNREEYYAPEEALELSKKDQPGYF